jgi:hypothetical protein
VLHGSAREKVCVVHVCVSQPHLAPRRTSSMEGGLTSGGSSRYDTTPGSLSDTAKAAPEAPAASTRGVPAVYDGGVTSSVFVDTPDGGVRLRRNASARAGGRAVCNARAPVTKEALSASHSV